MLTLETSHNVQSALNWQRTMEPHLKECANCTHLNQPACTLARRLNRACAVSPDQIFDFWRLGVLRNRRKNEWNARARKLNGHAPYGFSPGTDQIPSS